MTVKLCVHYIFVKILDWIHFLGLVIALCPAMPL
ncbi:hypothetical protein GYH30_003125 [Glycine max]|nr:hypothetical protein GYH30_003125 [Glycine max]